MTPSMFVVRRVRSLTEVVGARFGDWERLGGLAPLGLGIVLPYGSTFMWLVQLWWNGKEYSHGFLAPVVSVYLIWAKCPYLKSLQPGPSLFAGFMLLLASAILLVAGRAGGIALGEALSLLVVLPGIILL